MKLYVRKHLLADKEWKQYNFSASSPKNMRQNFKNVYNYNGNSSHKENQIRIQFNQMRR